MRVIDGATLDAVVDGKREGIRIIGIEAPQGNTPCGREAIASLARLVEGGVRLAEDADRLFDEDKLRLYYVVDYRGSTLIADEMVKSGRAQVSQRLDRRSKDHGKLLDLETKARAERRGCLWSEPPIPTATPKPPTNSTPPTPTELAPTSLPSSSPSVPATSTPPLASATPSASVPSRGSLGDRDWTSASSGWGPIERDRSNGEQGSNDGLPLTLDGVLYARGLGLHAPSDVRYELSGTCSVFTAHVGIDDEVTRGGSVIFRVFLDGVKAYESSTMDAATATQRVELGNLAGVRELRLVVTDGGDNPWYDHADWADPRLTCT